jgi:hypothetical protein
MLADDAAPVIRCRVDENIASPSFAGDLHPEGTGMIQQWGDDIAKEGFEVHAPSGWNKDKTRKAGPAPGFQETEIGLQDLVLLEEIQHGLGGLGTLLEPDLGLLGINANGLTGTADGIDETQHFHGAASGNAVVLGDDDVIEGPLLGTIAS